MKITAMFIVCMMFWGMQYAKAQDSVVVTKSEKEVISQELEKEAQSGQHDSRTKEFLQKLSNVFKISVEKVEVELDLKREDCAQCSKQQRAKELLTKIGRKLGKASAWVSTKTAKPFMISSGFVKGAVEKGDKNKDIVALYRFFLNHQEEFDKLYLQAGTPEEMIELMLAKMEEIMQKKSNVIMKDFLSHLGIERVIPEDLSHFELTADEIASIDHSKIDPEYINNHPEYRELRGLVGDMTKEELMDVVTSGYFNKSISFEKYKEALPSVPELVGTVVGQIFVPKIALGVISGTLAGLYMTPVLAADVGTAVSTAICLEKETRDQFEKDQDLKMFCSYVTNKSGYELLKGRAKGYIAGKSFHEKVAEKIKEFKEKRKKKLVPAEA